MSIIEEKHQKEFTIADHFILPSQKIINYDLTCNNSADIIHGYYHGSSLAISTKNYGEQKNPTDINNGPDYLQHNNLIVMADHAPHPSSSDSSIWIPADKHPQIALNDYEQWIKTYSTANQPKVIVSRKPSVLSNVSYNSVEEDSCGSDTSDEDDGPITPTLTAKPELTALPTDTQNHENVNNSTKTEDMNSKDVFSRRQDNICTDRQGSSSSSDLATPSNSIFEIIKEPNDNIHTKYANASIPLSSSANMQHLETQESPMQHTSPNKITNRKPPVHNSQKECEATKKSLNVDHTKTLNRKKPSWFKELFPKKSKKAGIITVLFSKKDTRDTQTTPVMKKPSPSTASKSLNAPPATLRRRPDSVLMRMISPTTIKRKQIATPLPPQRPLPIVHRRYPIDTEYTIYRLSHVKLSNARRPLRQQVVISNMMFWYLSVTEKEQDNNFPDYQEPQQEQDVYNEYQANQNQQEACCDDEGVYQASYQPFQPPAPGNGIYYYSIPNYIQQKQHNEYNPLYYNTSNSPSASKQSQQQKQQQNEAEENVSAPMNTNKSKLKNKYKPVRNTHYSPSTPS